MSFGGETNQLELFSGETAYQGLDGRFFSWAHFGGQGAKVRRRRPVCPVLVCCNSDPSDRAAGLATPSDRAA
eukprot:945830-Pyramimonas_sp.AAC.1